MSRCSNCGRESPQGAIFCLGCGARLAASAAGPTTLAGPGVRVGVANPVAGAAVSTPAGPAGLPGPLPCPVCGGENQVGMNFCRLCGSPLAGSRPPPPAGARPPTAPIIPTPVPGARPPPPEVLTCRQCTGQTPAGFAFCQHCGAMLPVSAGARGLGHTPPLEVVRGGAPTLALGPGGSPAARAAIHAKAPAPAPAAPPPAHAASTPPPIRPNADRPWGSLYSMRRDGTDGERHFLAGDWIEIGRPGAAADLVFEDRYLALRHARIEQQAGGGCRVVPIDLLNGVYRRIRAPQAIAGGTQILVGRELIRFELVADGEREAAPLERFGMTMFGSPPRAPWGRLVQVLGSGGLRDVRHLHGTEIVLGREEGEIIFRDDEFLSRRHAVLKWQGGQCVLEDLKSSNGTFVRLHGPQPLENGDMLRMGDQMFRFELGVGGGGRGG